jgi:hypothetical protein
MRTFSQRLWSYVTVRGPDDCWPWRGADNGGGYGRIRLSTPSTRRVLAHRAVFEECNGPLAPNEEARHTCDNPPCCNPAHLKRGTRRDNCMDAVERQRHARAGAYMPKLSAADAARIRELVSGGRSQRSVAAEYHVSPSTICQLVNRKTWKEAS